jgi:hypothetical protein
MNEVKIGTAGAKVRLGLWVRLRSSDGGADRMRELNYADLSPRLARDIGVALISIANSLETQDDPTKDSDG